MESKLQVFNTGSHKADTMANNICHNHEEIVRVLSGSDGPLSFTAPSGQETWSFYKVMIHLSKVGMVDPV
ncbi:hypothetical protein V6N13_053083 [Hibiscus sabdariffa]